jgi:predicted RNA-binding Zn ribbon-like protein
VTAAPAPAWGATATSANWAEPEKMTAEAAIAAGPSIPAGGVRVELEDLDVARARLPRLLGGRLCLDFANTVDPRYGPERREYLNDYADLIAWSRVTGAVGHQLAVRLTSASQEHRREAAGVLNRAIRLREALYRLFSGRAASHADLATLNGELRHARAGPGCCRRSPASPGPGRMRRSWT